MSNISHHQSWWVTVRHGEWPWVIMSGVSFWFLMISCWLIMTHHDSWWLIITHSDSWSIGLRNWNWLCNICMRHLDDLICLHSPLKVLIVLRWYESFFVLRNDDNVISKSSCNHDVIRIVTYYVWIMQYKSSNSGNIFFKLIRCENKFY